MEDNTGFIVNKAFKRLVVPTTLSNVGLTLSVLIDVALITHFSGNDGFVISSLFVPIIWIWGLLYDGIGYGASSLFSKSLGRGNRDEGTHIVGQTNTITLLASLCVTLIGFGLTYFFTPQSLNISQALFNDAIQYARLMFLTTIPIVMNYYLLFILRADSSQRTSALSTSAQMILNLALDLFFMGVLKMGIQGAALALFIASSVALLITLTHFFRKGSTLRFRFVLPQKTMFIDISRYVINSIAENASSFLFSLFNNITPLIAFGPKVASIMYIVYYIHEFSYSWGGGLARSTGPILCVYHGEGNSKAVNLIIRKGLIVAVAVGIVLALSISYFAEFIAIQIFNFEYPEMITQCVNAIYVYCLSIPFFIACILIINYCQLLGKFHVSIGLIISSVLIFPVFYISCAILSNNIPMIWWGFLFGKVSALLGWVIYMRIKQKKEKLYSIMCLPPIREQAFKASVHYLIRPEEKMFIQDYQDMAELFLFQNKIEKSKIWRSTLALEEIMEYAEKSHQRRDGYIAIQLAITYTDDIRIMVKLDNDNIDLKSIILDPEPTKNDLLSIHVLRSISTNLQYQRILSFNTLDIMI